MADANQPDGIAVPASSGNPFADLIPEGGIARPATAVEALARGIDRVQGTAYGAVEVLGEAGGFEGLRAFGKEGRERNVLEAAESAPPAQEFTGISNPSTAMQWAKETFAEQAPNIGANIAGGATGAYLGTFGGPLAPVTVPVGAVIGAFLPSFVSGIGEVQGNIKERDPNAVAPGYAIAGGVAIGALDSILPGKIGSSLVRQFGKETAEQIATKALSKQVPQSLSKEAGKSALLEGVTEAIQEAIGDAAAASGTGQGLDANLGKQMVEAFAKGALVGGTTSAGARVVEGVRDAGAPPSPTTPPPVPKSAEPPVRIDPVLQTGDAETPEAAPRKEPAPIKLYRGEPDPSTFDPRYADPRRVGRWYTTDIEDARGFAGPGGQVFELDVPPDAKIAKGRGKAADARHFTVPKALQKKRKLIEAVPAAEAETAVETPASETIPVDDGNPFNDLVPISDSRAVPPRMRALNAMRMELQEADPASPLAAALDQATGVTITPEEAIRSAAWARENGRQDIADQILLKAEEGAITAARDAQEYPQLKDYADRWKSTFDSLKLVMDGRAGADAPPTARVKMPQDVLGFIRSLGGIQDQTGDLRAMDAHKRGGLINNKNGLPPDAVRARMVEEGFLQDAPYEQETTSSVNDLYDLVDRALRGEKIYRESDQQAAEESRGQLFSSIQDEEDSYQIVMAIRKIFDDNDWPYVYTAGEEAELVTIVKAGFSIDDAVERIETDWDSGVTSYAENRGRASGDHEASESRREAGDRSSTRGTTRGESEGLRGAGEAREDELLAAVGGDSRPKRQRGATTDDLLASFDRESQRLAGMNLSQAEISKRLDAYWKSLSRDSDVSYHTVAESALYGDTPVDENALQHMMDVASASDDVLNAKRRTGARISALRLPAPSRYDLIEQRAMPHKRFQWRTEHYQFINDVIRNGARTNGEIAQALAQSYPNDGSINETQVSGATERMLSNRMRVAEEMDARGLDDASVLTSLRQRTESQERNFTIRGALRDLMESSEKFRSRADLARVVSEMTGIEVTAGDVSNVAKDGSERPRVSFNRQGGRLSQEIKDAISEIVNTASRTDNLTVPALGAKLRGMGIDVSDAVLYASPDTKIALDAFAALAGRRNARGAASDDVDQRLLTDLRETSARDAARQLVADGHSGITEGLVEKYRTRLIRDGLLVPRRFKWTPEADTFLVSDEGRGMTAAKLAEKFSADSGQAVTPSAVNNRRSVLSRRGVENQDAGDGDILAAVGGDTAPVWTAEQALRGHLGFRGRQIDLNGEGFFQIADDIMSSNDAEGQRLLSDWIDARLRALGAPEGGRDMGAFDERLKEVEGVTPSQRDAPQSAPQQRSRPQLVWDAKVIQPLIDGYREGGVDGVQQVFRGMSPQERRLARAFLSPREASESEMMAAVGGDLDTSPEARKQRAEADGFDTSVTYFRGTTRGAVDNFGRENRNSPDGVSGDFDAVFITRHSSEANGYTGVLEYDTPQYEAPPTMAQRAGLRPLPDMVGGRDTGSGGGAVYPLYAKRMRKFVWDYSDPDATNAKAKAVFPGYKPTGDAPNLRQARELQDALESAGYEAISIVDGRTGREAELAVFDPANIRSVNAQFDPSRRGDSDLMAAIGGEDGTGSAFEDASEESWNDASARGTANEWANERADSRVARQDAPTRSQLEREATSVMDGIRKLEKGLRAKKASPAEIAAAIEQSYGLKVKPDEIAKGNVWWRIDDILADETGRGLRRTPERVMRVAELYQGDGKNAAQIAGQLSQEWRIPVSARWVGHTLSLHGIRANDVRREASSLYRRSRIDQLGIGVGRTPERVSRVAELYSGTDKSLAEIADQLSSEWSVPVDAAWVDQTLTRDGIRSSDVRRKASFDDRWTPARVALFNTLSERGTLLTEIARQVGELPGPRVTPRTVQEYQRMVAPKTAVAPTDKPRLRGGTLNDSDVARLSSGEFEGKTAHEIAMILSQPDPARGIPARSVTRMVIVGHWKRVRDAKKREQLRAQLKKPSDEPMFAAGGWFKPDRWRETWEGLKNGRDRTDVGQSVPVGREDGGEGGRSAQGQSGARQAADAGSGVGAAGRRDGSARVFSLRGYVGRSIDAIPTAAGLSQRFVFLHPPKAKVLEAERGPKATVARLSAVPNWVARAHVVEIAPGVWTVDDIKVRSAKRMRGLGNELLTEIEQQLGTDLTAPRVMTPDLFRVWQKRDPDAVADYARFRGELHSRDRLQSLRAANAAIADAGESDTRSRNAARKDMADIDAVLAEMAKTDDVSAATSGQASANEQERKKARSAIRMGRPYQVDKKTVDTVLKALGKHEGMVPKDTQIGALSRITPTGDDYYRIAVDGKNILIRDADADVVWQGTDQREAKQEFKELKASLEGADAVLTFTAPDGSLFKYPVDLNFALLNRAFAIPSLDAVVFLRFDVAGDLSSSLRGEIGHEVVHVLRRQRDFADSDWSRLVAQAEVLRIMDGDYRTFLQSIHHQSYASVPLGRTGRDIYEDIYASLPSVVAASTAERKAARLEEKVSEEGVAHMVELYAHGALLPQETESIRDLLDDIISGRKYGRAQEAASSRRAQTSRSRGQSAQMEMDLALEGDLPVTPGLDMSPEARKERADEQGFDTSKVWYHGTEKAGFREFDESLSGTAGNKKSAGIFLTENRRNAQTYAGPDREAKISDDPDFDPKYDGESGIYSLYLRPGKQKVVDWDGGNWDEGPLGYSVDREAIYAKEQGYDSLHIVNITDEGPHGQGYNWGNETLVVFNPSNLRSVNAAFDPANVDSTDLLAAVDRDMGKSMRRDLDALGFYSKLDEVLSGFGPKDKVTAQTLQQRGVKLSEIEARGLAPLLKPVAALPDAPQARRSELAEIIRLCKS